MMTVKLRHDGGLLHCIVHDLWSTQMVHVLEVFMTLV